MKYFNFETSLPVCSCEKGQYLTFLAKCFKYRSLSKILLLVTPRGGGEAVMSKIVLGSEHRRLKCEWFLLGDTGPQQVRASEEAAAKG